MVYGGWDPFYLKFCINRPRWSEIPDFETIFARSASAVTPIAKKSSINTNRNTTSFPMSLRWSSYVAPFIHLQGQLSLLSHTNQLPCRRTFLSNCKALCLLLPLTFQRMHSLPIQCLSQLLLHWLQYSHHTSCLQMRPLLVRQTTNIAVSDDRSVCRSMRHWHCM